MPTRPQGPSLRSDGAAHSGTIPSNGHDSRAVPGAWRGPRIDFARIRVKERGGVAVLGNCGSSDAQLGSSVGSRFQGPFQG